MTEWLNARTLYDDLAIWEEREPFTSWFEFEIESFYNEGIDWHLKKDGQITPAKDLKEAGLFPDSFWITQAVADDVAHHNVGLPGIRVEKMTDEERAFVQKHNWNEKFSQQTHAITGDDEI